MPFPAAIAILAILSGFTSGALSLNTSNPVDLSKLLKGQAVYKVNQ